MPRRDWDAKREGQYGYLNKQRARAGTIRLARTRPVGPLPDAGSKRPRPSSGSRGTA